MPEHEFVIPAISKGVILPGWILTPYDKVVIRWIGGYWTINPNVSPSRYDANGNPNYRASSAYLLPGSNEGCLVALIGNPAISKWRVGNFGIVGGDQVSAGQLWVSINDSVNPPIGPSYSDNIGEVNIQVFKYNQYLHSLTEEKEIETFIEAYGKTVGIYNASDLKDEIASNSPKLIDVKSPSWTENTGQKIN